ncbi:MAG: tRNA (adenine-N(1)-)-methyltransferase catalytic subunit trm61 [Heterodermia speciosa]|uniref:tRNA (adenine(58)-N(1))-methyltransferase catalytic subunit TRM61 n=1 Tax=Heterodermia speciosa TaxID=116794 RepID=A0A8H3J017_9LECA|nr:MAG: tRNA (adenine-N(1)-)-methyltransferase catalytic subunit trm61 [Heterodermia speciosa]
MATDSLPPSAPPRTSPFLTPGSHSSASSLSILHLRRDQHTPVILQPSSSPSDGYIEGPVTNTRFGSFPHSTLINQPWGSQIRASEVDTGSRGRKGWEGKGKKRKRGSDEIADEVRPETEEEVEGTRKAIKTSATGFVHILSPTPELWTSSLPHRTQVVYTPDYSYILHRLRARPGSVIIEAGAGSGSFTHAAARAVFDGYPALSIQDEGIQTNASAEPALPGKQNGKVYSFEFHEQRCTALQSEIKDHGLEGIVELTHRDVCTEGFTISNSPPIHASAIFLDLPAPWLALKHLTRRIRRKSLDPSANPEPTTPLTPNPVLHPSLPIHICTFSPCIEQVTRTISTLRSHGWLDISMVELSAKKIETRRERVGLQEEGLRGVNASAANVEEAVERLREVEGRTRWFHEMEARKEKEQEQERDGAEAKKDGEPDDMVKGEMEKENDTVNGKEKEKYTSKASRLASIASRLPTRKLYKEGRLVHRPEPELKMHTSYLVFAIFPREWSDEDEKEAERVWGGREAADRRGGVEEGGELGGSGGGRKEEKRMSKRQRRKEAKRRKDADGGKVEVDGEKTDVESRGN